jgi:TetR/AcrR family transcriptional regulator, regulator of biofilm formation and stress response
LTESRRARGERRRQAILEATLTLVGRKGAGAVTHRAVAEEAGVPLAATTYYFSSKSELVREALTYAADTDRATVDALAMALERVENADELARVFSDYVTDWLGPGRAVLVSHYEISLEGARRPELAAISRAWTDGYVRVLTEPLARLGSPDPARDAWIVVSAVDGMMFDELSGPRPGFEREILRPALERLIRALV